MKSSKDLSTVESGIKLNDETIPAQTTSRNVIPPQDTTHSVSLPTSSTQSQTVHNESTDDELIDYSNLCSRLLNRIGNNHSKYLEAGVKLQEDMWDSCNNIIQNQMTLFSQYSKDNSIKMEFTNPFLNSARQFTIFYLNWISLAYDYALLRMKIYEQFLEGGKFLLPKFHESK